MDSQQYEQLAQETQAHRVALMLPDLYERAMRARENAQETRAVSADLKTGGWLRKRASFEALRAARSPVASRATRIAPEMIAR